MSVVRNNDTKKQKNLPKLMRCPLPPRFQINVNFKATWAVDDKISLSAMGEE